MNRTFKVKLRKATAGSFEKWKTMLPIILAEIRMTPNKKTGLSPFEILMGRPFPTPWARKPLVVQEGDLDLIREQYVRDLITTLDKIEGNVAYKSPSLSQEPTHPFQVGDEVIVKAIRKKNPGDFPYGPTTTVVAITRTAVLTENSPTWIHATRVKLVQKKEVITGADSPDLEENHQTQEVRTETDSLDLEDNPPTAEVLMGADSPDLEDDERLPQFWNMVDD
ncbi:uncharacterized protein RCH25_048842 [Pelodytes ibericus]